MAFSSKVKQQIRDRADHASEISGRIDVPLECSHINHNKKTTDYNRTENGVLMTVSEHLYYHLMYRAMYETDPQEAFRQSGLTYYQNEYAIAALWHRAEQYHVKDMAPKEGKELEWEQRKLEQARKRLQRISEES